MKQMFGFYFVLLCFFYSTDFEKLKGPNSRRQQPTSNFLKKSWILEPKSAHRPNKYG